MSRIKYGNQFLEIGGQQSWNPDVFTFEIYTTAGGQAFSIPTVPPGIGDASGLTYDYHVDWGDGNVSDQITTWDDLERQHVYTSAGTWTVKIDGKCEAFRFDGGGAGYRVTKVLDWGPQGMLKVLNFRGCINLTQIPEWGWRLTGVRSFSYIFGGTGLTSVPSTVFDGNYIAEYGQHIFAQCPSLSSLPDNLFAHTKIENIYGLCLDCSSLTSISGGVFNGANHLTTANNVFKNTYITSIPETLFSDSPDLYYVNEMFMNTPVTSIPANFLSNNTAIRFWDSTWQDCSALTGTVPEYWNYPSVASGDDCFTGCPSVNLTNWADIPISWGGGGEVPVTIQGIGVQDGTNAWYIIFSGDMDQTSTPGTSAFSISGETIVSTTWFTSTFFAVITVADASLGQSYTMDYTKPGSNMLKSLGGQEIDSFSNQPVAIFPA